MKLWWNLIFVLGIVFSLMAITVTAESDLWDDDDKEPLVRTIRGTKDRASGGKNASCKYNKGQWSDCDPKTNIRTRKMTLKAKSPGTCEPTKVIEKKCKKACRYEKGTFGSCVNNSITRIDSLNAKSDPTCEPTRKITRKCKEDPTTKTPKANKKNSKQ